MSGKRFKPETDVIYVNKGGGTFLCGDVWENDTPDLSYCARMTNTKSGWTFIAHGLVQYEDGAIEWDYSTGGYFGEVPGCKKYNRYDRYAIQGGKIYEQEGFVRCSSEQ